MLDQLQQQDRLPEVLYADGGYGRDENVVKAEQRGVDLQSPVAEVASQTAGELTVDEIRAGGESVNSGLKRRTGLGRLRTRGLRRVRMAAMLRCAGWNVLRALAALKKRGIRDFAGVAAVFSRLVELAARLLSRSAARGVHLSSLPRRIPQIHLALAA